MKKIFLLLCADGNNSHYVLIIFDERNRSCTKEHKEESMGGMAEYLLAEHFIDLQEGLIEMSALPCPNCERKRCLRNSSLKLIDQNILNEILELVYAREKDGVGFYIEKEAELF